MAQPNGTVHIVPGKNDQGEYIFSVVVKRTFQIRNGRAAQRCAKDHELRLIDAYYENGDPDWSTVQYESELAPYKPMADVVVIGKAYAPGGTPTPAMFASVKIADREKSIRVIGDRECRYRPDFPPAFTDPIPFEEMEIRYERSYGGRDEKSDPEIPFFYPRNYMGTGIAIRNSKDSIEGLPLPNLEDPADLLTPERVVLGEPEKWPEQPLPQGFGWFQRPWYPRCTFAGSYPPYVDVDTVTAEERLGLVPKNHIALAKQFRLPSYRCLLNNGASAGLMLPSLKGDEAVSLRGLSPCGLLEFTLPGESPQIEIDIDRGVEQLEAKLDTVSIRPDDMELDLIWRGHCVYDGPSWLARMKKLQVEVN